MSEKVAQKAGVPGIVAVAAIVIVFYSWWGANMLNAERQAAEGFDVVAIGQLR